MIVHPVTIKLKKGQPLILIPIGDIQSETEYGRLSDLVSWCVEQERNGAMVRLFGMGDYFESPSPSERAALASAKNGHGLHETTKKRLNNLYRGCADEMFAILKPLKGRFFGLLRGHHYLTLEEPARISTDEYLAQKLDCEYFGVVVVIKLLVNGLPFTILASHGYGSARTKGARLAKRLRMREIYLDANWYVMGHDNTKTVDLDEPLLDSSDGVRAVKQYYSGSGSFQRAYDIGVANGGYVEEMLYPPCSMGVVICTLKHEVKNGKPRLDYHISA